jgi:hypothetical protein
MVMEEVIDKLKGLQSILSEKYEIEKRIEESPKMLVTQEELLARLKKSYVENNAAYEALKARTLELKAHLFEAERDRETAEKQMDAINTQREYEALDKTIRESGEKEQFYRRDLLREEKNLQDMQADLKREEAMILQQEEELKEGKAHIEAQIAEMRAQIDELAKREEELSIGIGADVKFKFERIIRNKQGIGIVALKGGVCMGCHMILPAQFTNEVHKGNGIRFCPYCSRILYYLESEDGEESYFTDSDAGGLADLDGFEDDDDMDYADEEDQDGDGMGFEGEE